METINDVHLQFASFFQQKTIAPFLYLLSQKMEEGSTCLDLQQLSSEIKDDFPYEQKNLKKENLLKNDLVGKSHILDRPFILDTEKLYLQRYFKYEINLVDRIKSMVEKGNAENNVEQMMVLRSRFEQLFPNNQNGSTDWQKVAAFFALLNDFTIITGGPGTGKTTTVSKILDLCLQLFPNASIALAAPTGKAAARMTESLRNAAIGLDGKTRERFAELQPSTIHRLLGTIRNSLYFKHDKTNPLHYDIIVIDECSMIDIALFSKLVDAIGPATKLILLGDKDQLSSVDVGSLFGDLCKTVKDLNVFSEAKTQLYHQVFEQEILTYSVRPDFLQNNIIELKESRRFDKDKGIGKLANAVIQNDQTALETLMEKNMDEQIKFDFEHSDAIWKKFAEKYIAYIEEKDILKALRLLDDQRILCAVREGDFGTLKINQKVEDYLFKLKRIVRKNDDVFYTNRPIMVTENNYELGLYNGDIGILRPENGIMKAWFVDSENKETGLKSVLPGLISNMSTVFAMTIHKSQGSEFGNVMVVLPPIDRTTKMMTREILYTAITRAKRSVTIVASKDTILQTAMRQVQRSSGVAARF